MTYLRELPLVLLHERSINLDLRGGKCGSSYKLERRVATEAKKNI